MIPALVPFYEYALRKGCVWQVMKPASMEMMHAVQTMIEAMAAQYFLGGLLDADAEECFRFPEEHLPPRSFSFI
jgi:hypothetical protein